MASFRVYNIQLLPLDTKKTPEVGVDGYKKLFDQLADVFVNAHKNKTLVENSYKLANDTYFSPFVILTNKSLAYGKWVKYHKAEAVIDLYTNKSLFEAAADQEAVSNTFYFNFILDFEAHYFAIEELSGKLPSVAVLQKALYALWKPIAENIFPLHILTVNLVSQKRALEQALLEATGFRRVDVKVTFPNGHHLSRRLREMKENNVHVVKAEASSEKGSLMPKLPSFILELVRASTHYGSSTFTYLKEKVARKQIFSTEEYPEKISVRQKKSEQDAAFIERVRIKLRSMAGYKTVPIKNAKNDI